MLLRLRILPPVKPWIGESDLSLSFCGILLTSTYPFIIAWLGRGLIEPLQLNTHYRPLWTIQLFSTSPTLAKSRSRKRKHFDPYAMAQARQRKAANIARQATLRQQRAEAMGDPVLGKPSAFLESLDRIKKRSTPFANEDDTRNSEGASAAEPVASGAITTQESPLNYAVRPSELIESLHHSYFLTQPLPTTVLEPDLASEDEKLSIHQELHDNAAVAMARIMNLANGNSIDRRRVQIQECIEKFGRHRTDSYLPPKPAANIPRDPSLPSAPTKTPRAGPDTGSSEVQIAILTLKIRALASHLASRGKKDKINKRNLRLLVHRRQKLMRYLRRKERGAARWQHLVDALGLTDRMWKGEISLP